MHNLPQEIRDQYPDAVFDPTIQVVDMPSCYTGNMVLKGDKAKKENKTSIGSVYHQYQTQGNHLEEAIWRFDSLRKEWPGEEQEFAGHLVAANIAMHKATNGKIGIDENDRHRHLKYFKAQEKQWEKNPSLKGTFSALPEHLDFKNNQFYPLKPQHGGSLQGKEAQSHQLKPQQSGQETQNYQPFPLQSQYHGSLAGYETKNYQSSPLQPQYRPSMKGKETQNYQSSLLQPQYRSSMKGKETQNYQSFHSQENHTSSGKFGECSRCNKKIYNSVSNCNCGGRVYYPADFSI